MEAIKCLVCKRPVSVPPWNGYRPPLSFSTLDMCPECNSKVQRRSNDAAWHDRQVAYCLSWMETLLEQIRGDRLVPIRFVAMDSRLWALPSTYYVTESEPVIQFIETETPSTIDEEAHDRLVEKLLELFSRGILS